MKNACLLSLLRVITRNGVYVLALTLASIYFALPSLIPSDTGAFRFGAEFLGNSRFDVLADSVASGAYDTAPQNIKDANERQLALFEVIKGGDAAASLRAQEEVVRIDIELYEAGNLSGDYVVLEANHALLEGLAGMESPELYETTADEPMLYRLAELLGTVPPLLLIVSPIAIAYAAFRAIEDDRLGFQVPLSRAGKVATAASASLIVSMVSFLLALLPAALLSAAMNGLGDPSYPVVLIQAGEIVELTVLSCLTRTCGLLLAATLLVVAVASVAFAASSSSVAGCLLGLALGFVPSIPQYFSETFILHDVLRYLPTTYLYVAPVGGWPSYLNLMDVFPVPGASWGLGVAVLLAVSTALLIAAWACCMLRSRRDLWQMGGRDA